MNIVLVAMVAVGLGILVGWVYAGVRLPARRRWTAVGGRAARSALARWAGPHVRSTPAQP